MPQEIVEVPLAGKITTVEVKVGDMVKEGDVVCFIESMKMENPIMAPLGGKITEIGVAAGQMVATGKKIAVIEY